MEKDVVTDEAIARAVDEAIARAVDEADLLGLTFEQFMEMVNVAHDQYAILPD